MQCPYVYGCTHLSVEHPVLLLGGIYAYPVLTYTADSVVQSVIIASSLYAVYSSLQRVHIYARISNSYDYTVALINIILFSFSFL